jgi:hypothetical protein
MFLDGLALVILLLGLTAHALSIPRTSILRIKSREDFVF